MMGLYSFGAYIQENTVIRKSATEFIFFKCLVAELRASCQILQILGKIIFVKFVEYLRLIAINKL